MNKGLNKFLLKSFLLSLIVSILFIFFSFGIDKYGMSDWAYKRFTARKYYSLVIGTSRAAQGIQPAVINSFFKNDEYQLPIYNFSFTVVASPYGELYYNAIDKMVEMDGNQKRGLFILSVDPWALSEEEKMDAAFYRETDNVLSNVPLLNCRPNFLYLLRYFRITDPEWFTTYAELQDDGWYKVNFGMNDSLIENNVHAKLKTYYDYKIKKSDYRLKWLSLTVEHLKRYGDVFLCRIPTHESMLDLEEMNWPDFDNDMQKLANQFHIPYFNFKYKCNSYRTIDGNHLYKDDGARFTQDLCDSIKSFVKISGVI